MPRCKKPAKRSKSNRNETNIESVLTICSEGQYVQPENPVEYQKQNFRNRFQMQEERKYWWDMEEKSRLESKKKSN